MENKLFKLVQLFIIYIFTFFLLINEKTVSIYGLAFGILWKVLLLLVLITYVIIKFSKVNNTLFLIVYSLYTLKLLINTSFPKYFVEDITSSFSEFVLPVMYYFFIIKYEKTPEKIVRIMQNASIFFILSSVPYLLNLIQSTEQDTTGLDYWGGANTTMLLSGIFFDVSASSKVFVYSTIIIIHTSYSRFNKSLIRQFIYYFLIIIGLVAIYRAFTRTGWLGIILGMTIYFLNKKRLNDRLKIILGVVSLTLIFLVVEQDSLQIIENRIFGIKTYQKKRYTEIDNLTSSRSILYTVAIKTIEDADINELLFGYGTSNGKKKFTDYINREMVAHNKFLEVIISGGMVGILLYIWIIILIAKNIYSTPKSFRKTDTYKTTSLLFILFVFFMIPSHGVPIWCDFLFAGFLSANELQRRQTNITNELIVKS